MNSTLTSQTLIFLLVQLQARFDAMFDWVKLSLLKPSAALNFNSTSADLVGHYCDFKGAQNITMNGQNGTIEELPGIGWKMPLAPQVFGYNSAMPGENTGEAGYWALTDENFPQLLAWGQFTLPLPFNADGQNVTITSNISLVIPPWPLP